MKQKEKADRYTHIVHPIPPFYDAESKILILGSFPSVKTRESGFFYGHPQNRFWKLMTLLFEEENVPAEKTEKADLLKRHHIAVYDSITECDIIGSSDSSIRNVIPSDFTEILAGSEIKMIFTNGKKSHEVYEKYCLGRTGIEDICLPSTSPANAAFSLERLADEWSVIKKYL